MLRLTVTLVAAALLPLLGGCGGGGFQTNNPAFDSIASAPDVHRGELQAFHGRVIEARQLPGRGYEVQVDIHTSMPTLVVVYPLERMEVTEDDYVTVLGRVSSEAFGVNRLGGYQRALVLDGIAVQGLRGSGYVDGHESTYEAWKAGTLQLGSRPEPASASMLK